MDLFNLDKQNNKEVVTCEDCGKLTPPIYRLYGGTKNYVCADCYKKYKRYWFLILIAFLISIPIIFLIVVLLFKFNIL